ncbi:MAG: sulfur oxidation c-type cytochrome SoxX [gamma proteobacterium symbiont of Bathyaustriella thionipta]|nr:sulfur oxidation c-type cytochrome SoxX [gamma proteobacterium symbiont of Bathyaustriella thionipta]
MRTFAGLTASALSALVLVGSITLLPAVAGAADVERTKQGKELAFNRKKGNCLACHMIADGVSPGDLGPPLVAMKGRFPDRAKLRAQLENPMVNNPDTAMPPFGKFKILSDDEINKIIDYLYTL